AHELAHVMQQTPGAQAAPMIQRKIDEAQLPQKPAAEIMVDETYMDNNIEKLEFWFADTAIIHYKDGRQLELGLLPDNIKPPFESVDYKTPSSEHIGVASTEPGTLKYIPRGTQIRPPAGMTFGEVLSRFTQTVRFHTHTASGRIVPTQVNSRTAPVVCALLRECEKEYIRNI